MKVIVAGGGTGGHIYPALAISQGILKRWPKSEILFVGTEEGMESTIVPDTGLDFRTISAEGLDRSSMLKALTSALKVPLGFWQSHNIIKEFKPDVVIGTGGYVSYPVVMAATTMGVKTLIHEQNAYPGLANRALSKRVDYVMLTFPEAAKQLSGRKMKVTGLPVRSEIAFITRTEACEFFELQEDMFTILAFGGSRGAASINKVMLRIVKEYRDQPIQIIWITGDKQFSEIQSRLEAEGMPPRLRIFPYSFAMEKALAAADLAVCRAGAATISELAIRGLPAVFVPYPFAAEGHQEKNARALERKGAAFTIVDEFLDKKTLLDKIEELRNNKFRLVRMSQLMKEEARPRALEDILDIIEEVCKAG
ncbi:MAG: undecaprenyldiphospho-muramoylpentapeptide beta-N-acetylglucosaminyltransferase [Candidatus Saccharibacteria bacterium]